MLAGGRSAEREVSQRSGTQCREALESRGHQVDTVDLDQRTWDLLRDGGFECVFIALHGRLGEGRAKLGGCPRCLGGLGGTAFGLWLITRSW